MKRPAKQTKSPQHEDPLTDAEGVFGVFEELSERVGDALHDLEGEVYEAMTRGEFWTRQQIEGAAQSRLAELPKEEAA